MEQLSTQERIKRGAADAGRYFQFMSEFIGFMPEDAATIRETRFIIEKHIPSIVADFYAQLLRYPATRRIFLKYAVTSGQLLLDRHAKLPTYRVELRGDQVYVHISVLIRDNVELSLDQMARHAAAESPAPLADNELRPEDLQPGQARRVHVAGEAVAVYHVNGAYY